jgi:hypothetical protein
MEFNARAAPATVIAIDNVKEHRCRAADGAGSEAPEKIRAHAH